MTTPEEQLRAKLFGHVRFAAIAWMIALPVMYAALLWVKSQGGVPEGKWPIIAVIPVACAVAMVGSLYLTVAVTLAKRRSSEES